MSKISFAIAEGDASPQFNRSKKKKGKKSPKKKAGFGGYKSTTEGDVSTADRSKAEMLASSDDMLRQKLTEQLFVDACRLRGIEPSDLKPKSLADFRTAKGRAKVLPEAEQKLRYKTFEANRRNLLSLVVSQETKSIEKAKVNERKAKQQFGGLSSAFEQKLALEQRMVAKMKRSRAKYEKVLERENKQIMKGVGESATKEDNRNRRNDLIMQNKLKKQQKMKANAADRQKLIDSRVQNTKAEEERWKSLQKMKAEAKELRLKNFLANKTIDTSSTKKRSEMKRRHRQQARDAANLRQKAKTTELRRKLAAKGDAAARAQSEQNAKREMGKIQKQLRAQEHQEKANRVRKAKLFQKKSTIDKMHASYARMEAMKQMKEAIDEKRREMLREEKIRRDQWRDATAVERAVTPGPGAYELPSTLANSGGAWGKFKPKSDLDIIIARAALMPAPGAYGDLGSTLNSNGGSWSQYKPKSDVEWAMDRASKMPGPGEYDVGWKPENGGGVAFSSFTPKSELDLVILRAQEGPAPGEHQAPNVPQPRKKLEQLQEEFKVSNKAVMFAAKLRSKLKRRKKQS